MIDKILKNYKNSYKFFVPFDYMLEDGIIMNKNSGFQATFKVVFHDLDFMEIEEQKMINSIISSAFLKLPDGFTAHIEIQRTKSNTYLAKDLSKKPYSTRIIERIRENSVKKEDFFITEYYITLTYILNNKVEEKIGSFISKITNKMSRATKEESIETLRKEFNKEFKEFKSQLELFHGQLIEGAKEVELLKNEELLGYLYTAINLEKRERIKVPNLDMIMLDEYLTVSNIENKDNVVKINGEYLKVLTITAFPDEVNTRILNELESLNFEYRMVNRFIVLSKEEALKMMDTFNLYYQAKMKSAMQWLVEAVSQKPINNVDRLAENNLSETAFIDRELRLGNMQYGYHTFNFIIKDKDLEELEKKVQQVQKIIRFKDFVISEDKFNTLNALFGSIPGNVACNVRRLPINTQILTTLIPTSSIYLGEKYNKHLRDVPLIITKTEKELFNFNLHVGDVGHTFIAGPNGSGKSVLLGLIAAEFLKYDNININGKKRDSQVFFFDVGGSSRVLTNTSGGKFYDLGNSEIAFQPLKNIDEKQERVFVLEWIQSILENEGLTITPKLNTLLSNALKSLSEVPKERRTLSNLKSFIQSEDIRNILDRYTGQGEYAEFFDNDEEYFDSSNITAFEMGNIIKRPKVLIPLLDYLFHKIEVEKLDGRPTLIILDESWVFLKTPKMLAKIEEWIKTLRKLNATVILATQSLSDVVASPIVSTVLDNCLTSIFLPNNKALSAHKDIYLKFGLNDREIEEINASIPKRDYFIKKGRNSSLIQLNLTKTELAYVGSSSTNDQAKIRELKKEIDNKKISSELKLLILNQKWIEYKVKTGEITMKEIEQYKDILK